jgi:hypothetical protein
VGRAKLIGVGWSFLAFSCAYADTAVAQIRTISIPEQPLSQALKQIGQQTGLNILFTPLSVQGLRSHALLGRMTAQQALDELLRGTGLNDRGDGSDILSVAQPQQGGQFVPPGCIPPST